MRSRKWFAAGATAALLLAPVVAVGQLRAIRHSGLNCYLSQGTQNTAWIDLLTAGGPIHDWGIGSTKTSGGTDGGTMFCPVALDVPRAEKNSIEKVRIIYSTRDAPTLAGGTPVVVPKITNCTAYLMDGTGVGTWVGSADPSMGLATTDMYTDNFITIEGATARLGSENLRRMAIACTMPFGTRLGGSLTSTFTALIKGYEVQYTAE